MYIQSASYVLQLEGPNKWPELFEACNHGKQSPVNIETANVRYSSALTAFEMEGYDSIPPHSSWSIENNGKTGKLNFTFFCPQDRRENRGNESTKANKQCDTECGIVQ